ncbi:MAG: SPOR domain-containing protein [Alphaproteobacteria bacterium]
MPFFSKNIRKKNDNTYDIKNNPENIWYKDSPQEISLDNNYYENKSNYFKTDDSTEEFSSHTSQPIVWHPSFYDVDKSFDDFEDSQRTPILKFIFLILTLVFFSAIFWIFYKWVHSQESTPIPLIISAKKGPFKIRPENPGGLNIPHQDKLIYDRILPNTVKQKEKLLPSIETPTVLPELETQNYNEENNFSKESQNEQNLPETLPFPESKGRQYVYPPNVLQQVSPNEESLKREQEEEFQSSAYSNTFYVHLGSTTTESIAYKEATMLQKKHNELNGQLWVKTVTNGTLTQYSLLIGPFKAHEDAFRVCQHMGYKECPIISHGN